MRILYQVCKLVHADLSEYNVLFHNEKPWIIDVSQSVEHDHPRSLDFLRLDIKNVSDFCRRKEVAVLSERKVFEYIIAPEGSVQLGEATANIDRLMAERNDADEEGTAQEEVDAAVFRKQYIPQTLDQVYDAERDADQLREGDGDTLVYKDLLAGKVVQKSNADKNEASDVDSAGDGSAVSDDSSHFSNEEQTPRGKRFQDKDAKKEHKKQVKEEKREKRKEKMPKHIKKKLVNQSARKR